MTNYYYSHDPNVEHDEKNWQFELLGNNLLFTTDNGVFSKRTVDYGSRVLLKAVAPTLTDGSDILDLGCGYGPIGLALAAHFSDAHVDMVDVNNLALSLCKKNAQNNGLENVSVWESDCYKEVSKQGYDAIISNPPVRAGKKVVNEILTGAYDHLKDGGTMTVVLQKKQGAPSAKKKLKSVFGNCQVLQRDKGYFILQSVK